MFQCYHNNIGYCKYGKNCKYQHFYELCPKQVCRDEKCEFRHPKSCKFDGKCKFLKKKLCVYKHIANDDKNEIQDLEEKLMELEKTVSAEKQNVNIFEI